MSQVASEERTQIIPGNRDEDELMMTGTDSCGDGWQLRADSEKAQGLGPQVESGIAFPHDEGFSGLIETKTDAVRLQVPRPREGRLQLVREKLHLTVCQERTFVQKLGG